MSEGPPHLLSGLRTFLFGRRLTTESEAEERVSKTTGLAIFASDNISSLAYATEETMRTLATAGAIGVDPNSLAYG